MRAYPIDLLRRKIVWTVPRGRSKVEAARAFVVGHSSALYRALWPWCAALAVSLASPIGFAPRLWAASSGQPPSAAIIDSQATKTTERGGGARGYDGRKKISGRKRHLLVDSSGLVGGGCTWSEHRRSERSKAFARESCRQAVQEMKNVWVDRGYNGKEIGERMKERLGWT